MLWKEILSIKISRWIFQQKKTKFFGPLYRFPIWEAMILNPFVKFQMKVCAVVHTYRSFCACVFVFKTHREIPIASTRSLQRKKTTGRLPMRLWIYEHWSSQITVEKMDWFYCQKFPVSGNLRPANEERVQLPRRAGQTDCGVSRESGFPLQILLPP